MPDRSLLDAEFLLPFEDMSTPARIITRLANNDAETVRALLEKLVLYDRVVFPTVDMSIVPLLVMSLGADNVIKLLANGSIAFFRYTGTVGYVGAGNGLEMFEIRSPANPPEGAEGRPPPDEETARQWRIDDAASIPIDESLQIMTSAFKLEDYFGTAAVDNLTKLSLNAVSEAPAHFFVPALQETYQDVLGSKELQVLFSLRNRNLKRLVGINDSEVRWLHTRHWNDEIDILLHMAQFNMEIAMASYCGCVDQTSGPSARTWITAKEARLSLGEPRSAGFSRLTTIDGLPDLGVLAKDDSALDRAVALTMTESCGKFREWFHREFQLADHDSILRAYVELLKAPSLSDLPHIRVLRFVASAVTSALAGVFAGPAAALGVGAADSFVVEKFLNRGPHPKVFLHAIHDVVGKHGGIETGSELLS